MRKILSLLLALSMVLSTMTLASISVSADIDLDITTNHWRTLPYGESFGAYLSAAASTHPTQATLLGTAKDSIINTTFINNGVIYNGSKLFNHTTFNYGVPFNGLVTNGFTLVGDDMKYYKAVGTIWRKGNITAADNVNHIGEIKVTFSDGATDTVQGHGYTTNHANKVDTLGFVDGVAIDAFDAEGSHFITTSSATGHDNAYYPLTKVEPRSHHSVLYALIGIEYSIDELVEDVLPAIIDQLTAKKQAGDDVITEYTALTNTIESANKRGPGYDVLSELSEDYQSKYKSLSGFDLGKYDYASTVVLNKNGRLLVKNGVATTKVAVHNNYTQGSLNSLLNSIDAEKLSTELGAKTFTGIIRTNDGNPIFFDVNGLLPTLDEATGSHFDSLQLSTIQGVGGDTFTLSGKYLKAVAFVGNTHYFKNQFNRVTLGTLSSVDVNTYTQDYNTSVFLSGTGSDGTNATSTPYYLNYGIVYNDAENPIPVDTVAIDATIPPSRFHMFALYEIEYNFTELTTVMTKVINAAYESATLSDDTVKAIRNTIDSAEKRGYNSETALGSEVYAKLQEICPPSIKVTIDAKDGGELTVNTSNDTATLSKDLFTVTGTLPENATFSFKENGAQVTALGVGTHNVEVTISATGFIPYVQTVTFTVSVDKKIYPYGQSFEAFLNTAASAHQQGYARPTSVDDEFVNNGVVYNGTKLFNSTQSTYGVPILNTNVTSPYEFILTENDVKYYKQIGTIWNKGTVDETGATHSGTVIVTYLDGSTESVAGHGYSKTVSNTKVDVLASGTDSFYPDHYISTSDAAGTDTATYLPLTKVAVSSHNSTLFALIGIEYSVNELQNTVIPAIISDLAQKESNGDDILDELFALKRTADSAKARGLNPSEIEGYDEMIEPVNKEKFQGLTLEDVVHIWDGNAPTMAVSGNVPENTTITYKIGDGEFVSNPVFPSDLGVYTITAKLENANYFTLTLSATLSILAADGGGNAYATALETDTLKNEEGIYNLNESVSPTDAAAWTTPYSGQSNFTNSNDILKDGDAIKKLFDENEILTQTVPHKKYSADKLSLVDSEVKIDFNTKGLLTGLKAYQKDAIGILSKTINVPLTGKFIKYIGVIAGTNNAAADGQDISYNLERIDGSKDTAGNITPSGNYPLRVYRESIQRPDTLITTGRVYYNTDNNTVDPKTGSVYMRASVSHELERGTLYKSVNILGSDTSSNANRASVYSVFEVEYPFIEVGAVIKSAIATFKSTYGDSTVATADNLAYMKAITSTYTSAVKRGYNYETYGQLSTDDIAFIAALEENYIDVSEFKYDKVLADSIRARMNFEKAIDPSNVTVTVGGETLSNVVFENNNTTAYFDVPSKYVGKSDVEITVTAYPCDKQVYTLVVPAKITAKYYSDEAMENEITAPTGGGGYYAKYTVTTNLTETAPYYALSGVYGNFKLLNNTPFTGSFEAGLDKVKEFDVYVPENVNAETHKFILWDSLTNLKRYADIFTEIIDIESYNASQTSVEQDFG